jgi:glycine/D-amino acid oxidase-like deaminating enzyme
MAPVTAWAIAELVATGQCSVDLSPFSVTRFAPAGASAGG